MARFETPIDNPDVARALDGLDYQSVMLARNFKQSSRLYAFYDEYVQPDTLTYKAPDGEAHTYGQERISAIGEDGSLLHIRLHTPMPDRAFDPKLMNIAIISHVEDPNPATVLSATSEDTIRFDGTRQTKFTIGLPDEAHNLQIVDEPMNQLQWEIEKVLTRERALRSLAVVAMTGNGWDYRRSDRHWEKLRDLHSARKRVSRAAMPGMGYVALQDVQGEPMASSGQFCQKVVV